ncbi:polysaccharide pyruvyl transferase family protein [Rhabdaerophilum calidifontis]|uniref:polysaccharide pyruvyl transferase family protein n=1 Tax=Rhabdaerophilum calidifontis TaxID=2604328 RepID=UPI00140954FB|nr:polysaccharide pyruvyl transferase family protein [Rhabdaerophilum calidifontis]
MSKIICLGYFDRGNSGDEAFKLAHEWFFDAENIEFHKARIPAEDVRCRPVILGGGDVVAPFFLNWIPQGTKFSMVGVGLKYEQSSIEALKARGNDLDFAWYRNRIDVDLCRDAGMNCDYIPDIVFALRNHDVNVPAHLMEIVRPSNSKPTIVICLSDHMNSRFSLADARITSYLEYFKWEIARTLDELVSGYNIVFLPLSVYANHQDARFHYEVVRRMRNARHVKEIREALHPAVAISLVRRCDFMVSMKLHGNIYGLLTERNCVNIGVGRKQTKLYEEAGLDEVSLEPYSFTKDRFLKCFEAASQPKLKRKISA